MPLQHNSAANHFVGFDDREGLSSSNRFVCPACNYEVNFPFRSLSLGAESRWNDKPRKSKLQEAVAPEFESDVQKFLSRSKAHFVLDFHCPTCHKPYVVGFEWTEFHMADTRYFPVSLWSTS
jgi:hypothetical protein